MLLVVLPVRLVVLPAAGGLFSWKCGHLRRELQLKWRKRHQKGGRPCRTVMGYFPSISIGRAIG